MRTTALVMGIIGGVFGVLMALLALGIGGLADSGEVEVLAAAAFGFSVLGIVGGALTGGRPGLGAILLAVSGVGIIVAISAFGVLPGAFFLIGALCAALAWNGARKHPKPVAETRLA
jgi:hypothetical protein